MVLGIYGAGGAGKETLELAKQINAVKKCFEDIVFIDDTKPGEKVNSVLCITYKEAIAKYDNSVLRFTIALGEPKYRNILAEKIRNNGYNLQTLIHPSIYIPDTVHIGNGTIIREFITIACNDCIGENVLVNPFSIIGHDIIIGNNCVLSAGVLCGGHSTIGDNSYLGMRVATQEGSKIGSWCIIGMGSVVERDIEDEIIAIGFPARPMKKNENHIVFK